MNVIRRRTAHEYLRTSDFAEAIVIPQSGDVTIGRARPVEGSDEGDEGRRGSD
jgi:hypothetical protein